MLNVCLDTGAWRILRFRLFDMVISLLRVRACTKYHVWCSTLRRYCTTKPGKVFFKRNEDHEDLDNFSPSARVRTRV